MRYEIEITGEAMAPRFRPGQRVYVQPGAPVGIDDDAVVWVRQPGDEPPLALVGRVAGLSGSKLALRQFTQLGGIEVALADVVLVHRVVGCRKP